MWHYNLTYTMFNIKEHLYNCIDINDNFSFNTKIILYILLCCIILLYFLIICYNKLCNNFQFYGTNWTYEIKSKFYSMCYWVLHLIRTILNTKKIETSTQFIMRKFLFKVFVLREVSLFLLFISLETIHKSIENNQTLTTSH